MRTQEECGGGWKQGASTAGPGEGGGMHGVRGASGDVPDRGPYFLPDRSPRILFDNLQDVVNDCQTDITKFIEGNNSAGTRVRKVMQIVKQLAQNIRVEVQEQKNAL